MDKDKQHKRCEDLVQRTVGKNKSVHILIDAIDSLGCPLPKDGSLFSCVTCNNSDSRDLQKSISGGFTINTNCKNGKKEAITKDYSPQVSKLLVTTYVIIRVQIV